MVSPSTRQPRQISMTQVFLQYVRLRLALNRAAPWLIRKLKGGHNTAEALEKGSSPRQTTRGRVAAMAQGPLLHREGRWRRANWYRCLDGEQGRVALPRQRFYFQESPMKRLTSFLAAAFLALSLAGFGLADPSCMAGPPCNPGLPPLCPGGTPCN